MKIDLDAIIAFREKLRYKKSATAAELQHAKQFLNELEFVIKKNKLSPWVEKAAKDTYKKLQAEHQRLLIKKQIKNGVTAI